MKFVRFFTTALSVVVLLSGCNALKTMASQTMAMKDCNYSYHSVSNIVIADIACLLLLDPSPHSRQPALAFPESGFFFLHRDVLRHSPH